MFTHLFGMLYGGTLLASLMLLDRAAGRFRPGVYASFVAGWATLIPWVPSLLSQSRNQARWFQAISVREFRTYYHLSDAFDHYLLFIVAVALLVYFGRSMRPSTLLATRVPQPNERDEAALVVVALALLVVPIVPWAISATVTPMLSERTIIPSLAIGGSLLMVYVVRQLFPSIGSKVAYALTMAVLVAPALAYPVLSAYGARTS